MTDLRDSTGKKTAKILIVEDDQLISFHMKQLLETAGHIVTDIVVSGETLFEAIDRNPPDIILMDIILEGKMDGVEAAERVNGEYGIPVIYVTANSDPGILRRVENTFPYGYISKPVNEYELLSSIKTALYKQRMEKALLESELKYRLLFEHMFDAFLYLQVINGPDGSFSDALIVEANEALIRVLNTRREKVIGSRLTAVFKNMDRVKNDWRTLFDKVATDEETHRFKMYFKETDQWFGVSAYSMGRGYIGVIADNVTKTVKYQKRLEESEKNFKTANREMHNLLSSIDSILIGVSTRDEVTHWNAVAERVFGITAVEAIGGRISTLAIGWEWDDIFEGISICIHKNDTVVLRDVPFTNLEGGNGFLGITINPIRDDLGILNGFLIYGRDITKRRMMELQLLQDQKLKAIGELASGIAHEINTPTQYVINNLDFLKQSFVGLMEICLRYNSICGKVGSACEYKSEMEEIDNRKRELDFEFLLEEIPRAVDQSLDGLARVSKIIRSMKSFSHPDNDNKVLADINKIIADTLTISKNEWKYVADVETELDEDIQEVFCFPAEISQVLLNLIVNAAHAIKEVVDTGGIEKGRITVSSFRENGTVAIKISDNGIGIEEDVKQRIFDPFFTTKDVGLGTGQGLAISRSIVVDKHGGSINFQSTRGAGSTFIIRLPENQEPEEMKDE
ncbi:MAG: ATP-binding protein [Spirochaetota bacterium]